MGRITIGSEMVQFSCKLEADSKLWNTRAGRMNGKSDHAREINREIDKINVAIHAAYRELVIVSGSATPLNVKEAFQGIASSQCGVLELFREHHTEYEKRIGVSLAKSTWVNYSKVMNR